MSDKQRKLLAQHLDDASQRGASLCIGTDADPAGDKLATEIQALAPAKMQRFKPSQGKDWNDQAKAQKIEAGRRRQAALDMIEQIRKTQYFTAYNASEQEYMRKGLEEYWCRIALAQRQALIENAKRCRTPDELYAISRDPAAAAIFAAQGDLLDDIAADIERRGDPAECEQWLEITGHAVGKAGQAGPQRAGEVAEQAGVPPTLAADKEMQQKIREAEARQAMLDAKQRLAEAIASGDIEDAVKAREAMQQAATTLGKSITKSAGNDGPDFSR